MFSLQESATTAVRRACSGSTRLLSRVASHPPSAAGKARATVRQGGPPHPRHADALPVGSREPPPAAPSRTASAGVIVLGTMHAIDKLMAEHRFIWSVCASLDAFVRGGCVAASGAPAAASACEHARDRAELANFGRFLVKYGASHHCKEDIIFDAMRGQGSAVAARTLRRMQAEHVAQVELALEMLASAAADPLHDTWDAADRVAGGRAARNLSQIFRSHINKEDHIVYPLAVTLLTGEKLAAVDEACARVPESEQMTDLGQRLIAMYTRV